MLVKKVASFITENNLISKGDHVSVALSGGRDSVTLFYILNKLKSQFKFTLRALHINHGIRGDESDKDQDFVLDLCKSLGIECLHFKLSGFDLNSGEDSLRKARYTIFDDYLKQNANSKIATAHHLNDQIETYLMRLFKGSGPKGLLGIPVVRGNYIRPMLQISRDEINAFCKNKVISHREDSTNFKDDKLRNKIRLNLIPRIEHIFGKEYLNQFLKSHQEYSHLYKENLIQNYSFFEKIVSKKNENIEIPAKDFKSLSSNQKDQYLEYCFSYVYGLDSKISKEQKLEFESFVKKGQTGTKFQYGNSIEVLKDRDKLVFYHENQISEKKKKLYSGKSIKFENCTLSLDKIAKDSVKFVQSALIENICGNNIKLPLTVRSWEKGDFFFPLGSNNRQKLSDFFTNNKVSRINKKKIPIILNGNEIVWVAGYRIDNRYKVTNKCSNVFKLEMVYE